MNICKVRFGSWLAYAPRGTSHKAELARATMRNLKNDRVESTGIPTSKLMAQSMKNGINLLPFAGYFNPKAVLVPVPKSSLLKPGTLWVPARLADALVSNGLGKSSEECLRRVRAVPRSSGQQVGKNRPKAREHYESMAVERLLCEPEEIILVDDVITRGSTIMGGANRLAEAFPGARIRAFAMMRVMSDERDFVDLHDPCTGTITMVGGGNTRREP